MQNLNQGQLESLYQQYLVLKEILADKLPPELLYKIAKLHFAQISGTDLGFALFRVLWLGSDALIEEYLNIHTFKQYQIQDAFNRLAFTGTDEMTYCNGLDIASENFLNKHEWKLRWLMQQGASPFVKYDNDVPFIAALTYGNIVMLRWFLKFESVNDLQAMSTEDLLKALAQPETQTRLGLSPEDMQYSLIEAYEIYGLDISTLLDI